MDEEITLQPLQLFLQYNCFHSLFRQETNKLKSLKVAKSKDEKVVMNVVMLFWGGMIDLKQFLADLHSDIADRH